jgi:hypothetical protein
MGETKYCISRDLFGEGGRKRLGVLKKMNKPAFEVMAVKFHTYKLVVT